MADNKNTSDLFSSREVAEIKRVAGGGGGGLNLESVVISPNVSLDRVLISDNMYWKVTLSNLDLPYKIVSGTLSIDLKVNTSTLNFVLPLKFNYNNKGSYLFNTVYTVVSLPSSLSVALISSEVQLAVVK